MKSITLILKSVVSRLEFCLSNSDPRETDKQRLIFESHPVDISSYDEKQQVQIKTIVIKIMMTLINYFNTRGVRLDEDKRINRQLICQPITDILQTFIQLSVIAIKLRRNLSSNAALTQLHLQYVLIDRNFTSYSKAHNYKNDEIPLVYYWIAKNIKLCQQNIDDGIYKTDVQEERIMLVHDLLSKRLDAMFNEALERNSLIAQNYPRKPSKIIIEPKQTSTPIIINPLIRQQSERQLKSSVSYFKKAEEHHQKQSHRLLKITDRPVLKMKTQDSTQLEPTQALQSPQKTTKLSQPQLLMNKSSHYLMSSMEYCRYLNTKLNMYYQEACQAEQSSKKNSLSRSQRHKDSIMIKNFSLQRFNLFRP